MKTEDLEFFIDLAESHSMTQTAEKYYSSHQVVRKAIRRLETELNVSLLYTSNQGVTYTDAGSVLYHKAKGILQNVDELRAQLEPYELKKTHTNKQLITIALTPYLTEDLILKVLNEYQLKHSEVDIRIRSYSVNVGMQSLKTEQDVFIFPSVPDVLDELLQSVQDLHLEIKCIAVSELYIVASAKSEWAKNNLIDIKQLHQMPLLLPANRSQFDKLIHDSLQSEQLVNSVESLKNLVGMNVGVGLITKKEFDYYFSDTKKFAMVPTNLSPVHYYAGFVNGKELTKETKAVLKVIADNL